MAGTLGVAMTVEQLWHAVPGGSGEYVANLVEALAQVGGVDVEPLAAHHRAAPVLGELPLDVRFSRLPRTALYESWNRWRRPRAETLTGRAVDVVHATTWAVPGRTAPLVVTVHDLAFLREPGHFTRRGRGYFRRAWSIVRAEADAIVVPSRATKDDCVADGVDQERVHVVPHGVTVGQVAPEDVASWRRRNDLPRPYILWCGTLEPRKNVSRLVEAFAEVRRSGVDVDLVLVGPAGWGGTREQVAQAAAALPAGSVRVLGRLTRHELDVAYAGAAVFAFPSLWEGFGMPVLEAMAHGTPVLTSAATSMAEVVGGLATLVDPLDVGVLVQGLGDVLAAGPDAGADARRRHAASFTWDASARAHRVVYENAART